MASPVYEVVWPLANSRYQVVPLGPREQDLNGKTVCQLWNRNFKGDRIFAALRAQLSLRFPGVKFVGHEVFGKIDGQAEFTDAGLLRENECDLVIAGIGG